MFQLIIIIIHLEVENVTSSIIFCMRS